MYLRSLGGYSLTSCSRRDDNSLRCHRNHVCRLILRAGRSIRSALRLVGVTYAHAVHYLAYLIVVWYVTRPLLGKNIALIA